jgi:hypothetical protein
VALLYQAHLSPTKLELLGAWLPARPWYRGPAAPAPERIGSYRFDDPDGEVGIETLLVRTGDGPPVQAPLTYRGAPLDGAEAYLLGTAEHSVLGRRWIYDGCGDPVYAAALTRAIVGGTGQAELLIEVDGRVQRRAPSMSVAGTGSHPAGVPEVTAVVRVDDSDPTVITTELVELSVWRVLDGAVEAGPLALTGTWAGRSTPVPLARARIR